MHNKSSLIGPLPIQVDKCAFYIFYCVSFPAFHSASCFCSFLYSIKIQLYITLHFLLNLHLSLLLSNLCWFSSNSIRFQFTNCRLKENISSLLICFGHLMTSRNKLWTYHRHTVLSHFKLMSWWTCEKTVACTSSSYQLSFISLICVTRFSGHLANFCPVFVGLLCRWCKHHSRNAMLFTIYCSILNSQLTINIAQNALFSTV